MKINLENFRSAIFFFIVPMSKNILKIDRDDVVFRIIEKSIDIDERIFRSNVL